MFSENEKGGDTPPTPIQRLLAMASNPVIAKLREPGTGSLQLPVRNGRVRFKLPDDSPGGRLVLTARGDKTVAVTHQRHRINEVVSAVTLVRLSESGDPSNRDLSLWISKKQYYVQADRKDLRKFLLSAGILNES